MSRCLRIGEVAKVVGLNPKTIRYYEEIGLLPHARRSEAVHGNGYRLYAREDVQRLEFIRRAKLMDLSLTEIRDLVATAEQGCCSSVNPKLARIVEQKLGEIDQRISDLEALRKMLRRLKQQFREALVKPGQGKQVLPVVPLPCQDKACDEPKREVKPVQNKEVKLG